MALYILKRIIILIPTLFAIMVVSFLVSRNTPGDPVVRKNDQLNRPGAFVSRQFKDNEYRRISHNLGLDLPMFYFTLNSSAYPDTLYRILKLDERSNLEEMIGQYGNWPEISNYYHAVCKLEEDVFPLNLGAAIKYDLDAIKLTLGELRNSPSEEEVNYRFGFIAQLCHNHGDSLDFIETRLHEIEVLFSKIQEQTTTWKLYVPRLNFYGSHNQFQHWLWRMIHLDFGKSYRDHLPVRSKIKDAMPWTIFMGFFSFILAYSIAIPVGVYSVRNRNTWQDKTITTGLFLLYSIPSFVMGMLLMTFLCNPEYIYLFPTSGLTSDGASSWSLIAQLKDYAWHLTLPTLVYSYTGIAFLSRQMRSGMMETVSLDYIRTARAKGLPEKTVIWKHAFRNSILPIVTHFSTLFPRLISGAIITETIFSIPGMGRLTIESTFAFDHPTILAIFTLGAILTLIGILVSDILYALVDPRITYGKK